MSTSSVKLSNRSSRNMSERNVAAFQVVPAPEIWKFKRDLQSKDVNNVNAGCLSGEKLNWFSGGLAKRSRLINSPF